MPKYIDADEFVKKNREWYCEQCEKRKGMKRGRLRFVYEIGGAPCRACDVDDVISDIEDFPAADVVPVVRCKDCKYKPTAPDGITHGLQVEFPDKWANRCLCLCEDGWYSWVPDDNFFCGYGVKEGDNGE